MIDLAIILGLALAGRRPKDGRNGNDGRDGRNPGTRSPDGVVGPRPMPLPLPDFPSSESEMRSASMPLNQYDVRCAALEKRALSGSKWFRSLQQYAPPGTVDIDVWAAGICKWIGIESGGNPNTRTPIGEVGLTQLMTRFADKWTSEQIRQYQSDNTPANVLASLVWKHVNELDIGVTPGWSAQQRLWRCYSKHGLPALYKSLAQQGFLVDGPQAGSKLDDAWTQWEMPGQIAKYATMAPKGTARGALIRFVAAADVVAGYRRNWGAAVPRDRNNA